MCCDDYIGIDCLDHVFQVEFCGNANHWVLANRSLRRDLNAQEFRQSLTHDCTSTGQGVRGSVAVNRLNHFGLFSREHSSHWDTIRVSVRRRSSPFFQGRQFLLDFCPNHGVTLFLLGRGVSNDAIVNLMSHRIVHALRKSDRAGKNHRCREDHCGAAVLCQQGGNHRMSRTVHRAGTSVPRPWWSYLRFGVHGLIIVVLILGAWLGWIVRGARIQREAVAAIRRAGGIVTYDYERTVLGQKPGPRWLVDFIGIDYLDHVFHVSFRGNATDQVLAHVGGLSQLEWLALDGSAVTDSGLAHLHGLQNLRSLLLSKTYITDGGLRHIAELSNLSYLSLDKTAVTDAGLAHLERLTRLKNLELEGTRVTDAGARSISRLTALETLWLSDTRIGDAGLKKLKDMRQLRMLYVDRTLVSDEGLEHLKDLPRLSYVTAQQTRVTDLGVRKIKRAHARACDLFLTLSRLYAYISTARSRLQGADSASARRSS